MIIVDANVLLYAVNTSAPLHPPTRKWLERALNANEPVGFTWLVLLAFTRISTLSSLTDRPMSVGECLDVVDEWLSAPAATVIHPTSRHFAVLRGLLVEAGTAGNLTNDAHLAAIAIEHGAQICTFDRDFARFGVSVIEPPT